LLGVSIGIRLGKVDGSTDGADDERDDGPLVASDGLVVGNTLGPAVGHEFGKINGIAMGLPVIITV